MYHAQLSSANVGTAGTRFQTADASARARAAPAPRLPPNDLRKLRGTLMRVGSDVLVRDGLIDLVCEFGASRAEGFPVQPVQDALNQLDSISRHVLFAATYINVDDFCSDDSPRGLLELADSVSFKTRFIDHIRIQVLTVRALTVRECANLPEAVETVRRLQEVLQAAALLDVYTSSLMADLVAIETLVGPLHPNLVAAARILRDTPTAGVVETLYQAVEDLKSRCSVELTPHLLHAAADNTVPPSFYPGDEPIFEAVARSFDEEGLDVGALLRTLPGREDDVWAFLQRPDVWIELMNDFKEDDPATLPLVKMPEGAAAERLEPVLRAISGLVGRKPHVVVHLAPGQTCNLNLDFPNKKAAAKVLEIDIDCDSMAKGEIIVGPAVQVASESREPCPGIRFRTADGRERGHLEPRGAA